MRMRSREGVGPRTRKSPILPQGPAFRLSAFTVVDAYADTAPVDRLLEVVRLAEAAEAARLSAFWVAEHHFGETGCCPCPPVLLAALGARTQRLRLGALVSVLPFHEAADLAEQYGMLDRLVEGRLGLGVGSGYVPLEFSGFGIDPLKKEELFERRLESLLSAFGGEEVRAGGPGSVPVRLNVRPFQRPHPPLVFAVRRRESVLAAARRGFSIALAPYATLSAPSELASLISEYRSCLPAGARASVSATCHLYAGPRVDRARESLQRFLDARSSQSTPSSGGSRSHGPREASAMERNGWALFGSPSEVAQRLLEFRRLGVDEILGIFDFGALPIEDAERSVRTIGAAFSRSIQGSQAT